MGQLAPSEPRIPGRICACLGKQAFLDRGLSLEPVLFLLLAPTAA